MILIGIIVTMVIMWQYQYSWYITILFSYLSGIGIYILLATDNMLSAIILNLITEMRFCEFTLIGYLGMIGLLLISPPFLLIS